MTSKAKPVTMPATKREGLANAVQIAINCLDAGDAREAMLQMENRLDDGLSESNPYELGPVAPKSRRKRKPAEAPAPEPARESSDERAKRFTAGEFLNSVFAFLTAGCDHYEATAPTVRDHLDDVYRRMIDAKPVTWLEIANVLQLRDEQSLEWEHPNYAANRIYKLRRALGMDVTGHAGF